MCTSFCPRPAAALWRAAALVIALGIVVPLGTAARAQVAGQVLGACSERAFLTVDQLAAGMAMAALGADIGRITLLPGGDDVSFGQMRECARKIHYAVCTDKLLFGLLDPVGSAAGGAAGLFVDGRNGPSLLGGLLGSGALGMVGGAVSLAGCNRRLEEQIRPPAVVVFGGWQIRPDAVRVADVRGRIASAGASRRITAEQAQSLLGFVDGGLRVLTR